MAHSQPTFHLASCLVFACLSLLPLACDRSQPSAGDSLSSALQSGNWQAIYNECKKDSTFQQPETLGLRGHACILLNRNNESYRCLNGMDSIQQKNWLAWAGDFVRKNPKLPVAHYFLGDASMRNGKQTEALRSFDKALEIDTGYALARNARATAYALEGKFDLAGNDAFIACQKAPGVAEFMATKAAILYQNKSAEGAHAAFNEALTISPGFAMALNGRACSIFYDINAPNPKSQLDSISAMLYSASVQLDMPAFRENTRSLIFEFENDLFPEQAKTPLFRVSDFLDWQALHQLSLEDKNDFFRNALGRPLPDTISTEILLDMNLLLDKKDLFKTLEKYFSAQVKQALKKENAQGCEEGALCYNRLAIEEIYAGLIVPYFDRKPGMNIQAQTQTTYRTLGAKAYGALEHIPGIMDFTRDMGDIVSAGTKRPEVKLITYAATKSAEVFALGAQIGLANTDTRRMLNSPTQLRNEAILWKHNPIVAFELKYPGGAIAEIRRKHVDDISKPYFLICNYGLGYDYQ